MIILKCRFAACKTFLNIISVENSAFIWNNIFCKNDFTFNFDQLNVSLLNKRINFFQKKKKEAYGPQTFDIFLNTFGNIYPKNIYYIDIALIMNQTKITESNETLKCLN